MSDEPGSLTSDLQEYTSRSASILLEGTENTASLSVNCTLAKEEVQA